MHKRMIRSLCAAGAFALLLSSCGSFSSVEEKEAQGSALTEEQGEQAGASITEDREGQSGGNGSGSRTGTDGSGDQMGQEVSSGTDGAGDPSGQKGRSGTDGSGDQMGQEVSSGTDGAGDPSGQKGQSGTDGHKIAGTGEAEDSAGVDAKKGDSGTSSAHDKVAAGTDMTAVEDVVEAGMTPITGDMLNDGEYHVTVDSSSSMFKIESAVLTVSQGKMTAVMTMSGTGYLCLYMGTGEQAAAAGGAGEISFEENSEGKHTFKIPVEALDLGIACAAYSKRKEMWYDRTLLFRSDSLSAADGSGAEPFREGTFATVESLGLKDGSYRVEVRLAGGSGRASVESPTELVVEHGEAKARITWSSSHYDYMLLNGEKYLPVNDEGNSVFLIPVSMFDRGIAVVADTTAMSKPYEIEYVLSFDSSTIREAK